MKQEISYINYAKALGIILVVLGHIGFMFDYIYAFHMPLFFFISGFLFSNIDKKKPKQFFISKIKSLLIPYLVFSIFSYVYWIIIERKFRSVEVSPKSAFKNVILPQVGDKFIYNVPLWFLIALFTTFVIVFLFLKLIKSHLLILILSIISFILFSNNQAPSYYYMSVALSGGQFFFISGYLIRYHFFNKLGELTKVKNFNLIFTTTIGGGLILIFSRLNDGPIGMMGNNYGNLIYASITSFSGIVLIFSLSILLSKINKKIIILDIFGKNSLFIMGVHEPLKRILIVVVSKVMHINQDTLRTNGLYAIPILFIILAICLLGVMIIPNKIKPYFGIN